MKTKPNRAIKALRTIIKRSQAQFAAMIGSTRDAVASWEGGRNRLSRRFAERISSCTGALSKDLIKGSGIPRFMFGRQPYSERNFEWWRADQKPNSTVEVVDQARTLAMSLEVLMLAAAKPGGGRITHRLPAVYDSFLDWVEQTCKDFRLQKQIDEVLAQRKYKNRLTMTWGDWRRKSGSALGPMLKERFGFKDNKRKPDNEELTLEVEECINWQPGGDMSGVDLIRTARDLPDLVTELSDEIIAEWIATAPHGLFVDDPTKQKGPD